MIWFNKSQKLCTNRMEPFFYKAMTLVKFINKLIAKTDTVKRKQNLENALRYLDKGAALNGNSANLFYHRGLLKFALAKPQDSIQDFEKAIEKSEDNVAKYFYVRGLAYACLKCFK